MLIGRMQVCTAGDRGERCAKPGEVRWCQAMQAFVGCQAEFKCDMLRITNHMSSHISLCKAIIISPSSLV